MLINLFVGSEAEIKVGDGKVHLKQVTNYPWHGKVVIHVDPAFEAEFNIKVRIPGWARGVEKSIWIIPIKVKGRPTLTVNGSETGELMTDR